MSTGLTAGPQYEFIEACVAAGLDLERWSKWEYDRDFMIKVLAWHKVHDLVDAHVKDAQATAEERAIRKAKKGRR